MQLQSAIASSRLGVAMSQAIKRSGALMSRPDVEHLLSVTYHNIDQVVM
jgi:hypothetical protein